MSALEEDYLTVQEAALILGVSERSIYGYIEEGRLEAVQSKPLMKVRASDVHTIQRRPLGTTRAADSIPVWRKPPERNSQYITVCTAPLRKGHRIEEVENFLLLRVYNDQKHKITGTTDRYVALTDENEVQIVLFWRQVVMPPEQQRQAAIKAFCDELADMVDWKSGRVTEGQVGITTR